MNRVALYARVSMEETDDSQRRYQEPENQLAPLRRFASDMGWEICKEYVDRMSGANPARPAFREMMNDAMLRRFNGILIWKSDRFSREGILSTLSYLQQLRNRGIWLKSYTESWMDTSQEGVAELLIAVMSWLSAEERRKISERTTNAIREQRALGHWRGGRPKGSKDKKPRRKRGVAYAAPVMPQV